MKELVKNIEAFLLARAWCELPPGDLAKSISIEAAELLELFQWRNPSVGSLKQDTKLLESVGDEIADVMIYALELCVVLDLDPSELISDKLNRANEKYPAHLMRKDRSPSSNAPANDAYYAIKTANRGRDVDDAE